MRAFYLRGKHANVKGAHWRDTMEQGKKIGLGTMEYELIQVR